MEIQLINVDGQDIEVMNYDFSKKEIDLDSGRNLEGKMERNVLEHHPRTLDIVLPPMNKAEMNRHLRIFDKPTLIVSAYDPVEDSIQIIEMMHGDLNTSLYWNADDMLYNAMKIQLVEY